MTQKTANSLLVLLACSFLLFSLGSGQLPLMGPDEPRYSQVAREMFTHKDFITPTLGGNPWFEKPVLLYWMQSAAYSLFGVTEWAARLPSILAAIFAIWILTYTVRRYTRHELALLSGIVLATSLFFIGFSHAATFDMLLTACVTASLCCFLLHETEPHRPWLWYAYAAVGAGILAKGFVAPILIGLAMLSYLVVSGRIKHLREYRVIQGAILSAAVSAIWLLPVTLIHGFRFWDDFFLQHHLMRYTTSQYHRSGGALFYISVFLAGSYPWTPALFLKSQSFSHARSLRLMAWCWFISTFIFFSFSQSKLPGYILPLMPAFAVIAGLSLWDVPKHWRRPLVLFTALQVLMVTALFLSAGSFPLPSAPIYFAATVVALLVAGGLYFYVHRKWTAAIAANALIPIMALLIALLGIYPATDWDETRNLAATVRPELDRTRKLLLYHVYNFPMVFYTNALVELTSTGYFPTVTKDADLVRYLLRHGEGYVVVGIEELEWMRREPMFQIKSVIQGPRHAIVLLGLSRHRE